MSKNMMNDHNQSDDQSLLFENIIDEKIIESNKKEPKRAGKEPKKSQKEPKRASKNK